MGTESPSLDTLVNRLECHVIQQVLFAWSLSLVEDAGSPSLGTLINTLEGHVIQ